MSCLLLHATGLDAAIIRNLLGSKSQSVSPARPAAVIEQAHEQDAGVIHVPLPDQDTREVSDLGAA
jgi:hypothetical protein